jgi:phosphoglycolate phosphatase-like HAD superfamily hydrolase
MQCSECSKVIKPVVAIDIDGTLGDYHSHFARFAYDYMGSWYDTAEYDGSEPHREWFCRNFNTDVKTFREVKLAYRQGGLKRFMPIMPGAQELVHQTRSAGAEVWLTTTRPYLRLDNIDPDTREWLDRHGFDFDGLLYDEEKYQQLVERIDAQRVIAIVDDDPEQLFAAADIFGVMVPIPRKTQYQRKANYGDLQKPLGLYEALSNIFTRINDWNKTYA